MAQPTLPGPVVPKSGFEPAGWALARLPVLPVDMYPTGGDAAEPQHLMKDPRFRAAIAVGAADMFAALRRCAPARPPERLRAKLLRYVIRATTRPTPYGMFAGVGLVRWGASTNLALAVDPLRTHSRPDMAWLLDVVARVEGELSVRRGLRFRASQKPLVRGGRGFLAGSPRDASLPDPTPSSLSVRASPAVLRAIECAQEPVSGDDLAATLLTLPGATRAKVDRLLDDLWRHGVLETDLLPPLTCPDPARYVRDRLRRLRGAQPEHDALQALLDMIEEWDRLPFEKRADHWVRIATSALGRPRPVAQVDLAFAFAGDQVHRAIGEDAATAAELLLRLTPQPSGPPHLHDYRARFEARFGAGREVPLLELLDPEFGLGPPAERPSPEAPATPREDLRMRTLQAVALAAIRDNRTAVELDDDLLDRLQTWSPGPDSRPSSLDLSVFVVASDSVKIDAGDFTLVVGPNIGASSAARGLGRFVHLIGVPATEALEAVTRRERAIDPRLPVELVYVPRDRRAANLAIRPRVGDYELVCGTSPGIATDRVVPWDELLVGIREGRFSVRWPRAGAEIAVCEKHMLNRSLAPEVARFLIDAERDGRAQLSAFGWGPAARFPMLPRIQRGRIVLSPARWHPAEHGTWETSQREFGSALAGWRARWSVPRDVYLAEGDQRLLLDLEDPAHANVLREEIARNLDALVIEEALPTRRDAWVPGPDGYHIAELVVPLIARVATRASDRQSSQMPEIRAADRLRPPGSDWLYLKLYCPPSLQEDIIVRFTELTRSAEVAELFDRWFFIRYADPDPHLRIRFHGPPDALLDGLLPQVCTWARELVAAGAASRFAFDTYEREVERYGGVRGVELAECAFGADSRAVVALIALERDAQSVDRTTVAVLGVDRLLESVGLGVAERLRFYRERTSLSRADGAEYRGRRDRLRELLAPAATGDATAQRLARILEVRRSALAPLAEELAVLARETPALYGHLVHMHANRLLGTTSASEARTLQLARRMLESLAHTPSRL